jgi:hypothetical protein
MRQIKKFENFNTINIDEIKSYFLDFIDDTIGLKYPIDVEFNERNESIFIRIKYDFYYQVWVEKDIDEIIKRLRSEYKVKKFERVKSGEYNQKELPVHGTNRTSWVSDPIYLIKIIVKK